MNAVRVRSTLSAPGLVVAEGRRRRPAAGGFGALRHRRGIGLLLLAGLVCTSSPTPAQGLPAGGNRSASPAQSIVALDRNKVSYTIGYQIGSQFANGDPPVDLPTLEQAIEDAYRHRAPALPLQTMREQLQALDTHMHDQALRGFQQLASANARKSAEFLRRNRTKPGVIELPSGIQYRVIARGQSRTHPDLRNTVTINYRGMLADGTEFDSTWAHGAPATFIVSQVIPGWREILPRMHVGDRWNVVIPPQQAFGERGELPRIGPNEVLVFDIQLLSVKP